MLHRLVLATLLCATAGPLYAFFEQPAGYTRTEQVQSFGTGGPVWDPATGAADFYAQHDGGLRRYDTVAGAFSTTLTFATPPGRFFDSLAIDPTSPDDFYASYSSGTNSGIYKLQRTGPDAATQTLFVDYASPDIYIYRLAFIPDLPSVPANLRGQLIVAATPVSTFVAAIYLVNKTTLALTQIADVGTSNGNGPLAVDNDGNIYTVIPPSFLTFQPVVLLQYAAADISAAVTGTPVPASQANQLIPASAGAYNISAMAARDETGGRFLYYSTVQHASIFRMCLQTGESREFIKGFGGTSDGYSHSAQGGTLAFSSTADDFHPAGGGSVKLLVPFSVFTPGFGSYRSLFFFEPTAVNTNVVSLNVTQQPTGINSGLPFAITVQALDVASNPITAQVAVSVSANGNGELHGFTVTAGPGNALVIAGLAYTTATLPETITLTIELSGNSGISTTTASISVLPQATAVSVTTQPSGAFRNEFFPVTVELHGPSGELINQGPDATREVSVIVQSGPGAIWGQTTVQATGGIAQFNSLLIDAAGSYTLRFESDGLTPQTITLSVAAPAPISGGDGNTDGDSSNCSTGGSGSPWPVVAALMALACVAARLRRVAGR